ncbi:hypothetical protein HPP92_027447 [Vanilla planifolia]|uniref:UDP-glycosyltransferases domain-containing protein n=1 Tax=Vanilla planifolia TaxID=51239 RepID=A0A835PCF4_VANPL|nr:hypothetical protein HPP92_027447 [Vanilla planifolia]
MDACELYLKADGILVNSFEALESAAYKRLRARGERVYAIGPMIRCHSSKDGSAECMKWLDRHPCRSVVFVSFGTMVQISSRQVKELAYGLESSGQRFLWLLPADGDCEKYLPKGFVERTRDVGMVVGSWVPQAAVLSHVTVGGFVSHCGWNSTLESLANGVPMVAWPIQYDQRMNALLLMEGVGVALRLEASAEDEDGFVCRVAVEEIVKEQMEGERGKAVRARAAERQKEAKKAIEEDGSSWKTLAEVASMWEGNGRLL